jgi:hypothetical protein
MIDSEKGTHVGESFTGTLIGSVDNLVASPLTTMIGNGF